MYAVLLNEFIFSSVKSSETHRYLRKTKIILEVKTSSKLAVISITTGTHSFFEFFKRWLYSKARTKIGDNRTFKFIFMNEIYWID